MKNKTKLTYYIVAAIVAIGMIAIVTPATAAQCETNENFQWLNTTFDQNQTTELESFLNNCNWFGDSKYRFTVFSIQNQTVIVRKAIYTPMPVLPLPTTLTPTINIHEDCITVAQGSITAEFTVTIKNAKGLYARAFDTTEQEWDQGVLWTANNWKYIDSNNIVKKVTITFGSCAGTKDDDDNGAEEISAFYGIFTEKAKNSLGSGSPYCEMTVTNAAEAYDTTKINRPCECEPDEPETPEIRIISPADRADLGPDTTYFTVRVEVKNAVKGDTVAIKGQTEKPWDIGKWWDIGSGKVTECGTVILDIPVGVGSCPDTAEEEGKPETGAEQIKLKAEVGGVSSGIVTVTRQCLPIF